MQEMPWFDEHHIPGGTIEGAIALANQLYWSLSVVERAPFWFILSGEKVILKTDSREVVDAFFYGMGLAYGCLPEDIFEHLREEVKRLVE